jgi:hypothetical protein
VKAALANSEVEHKADAKKKAVPRKAAGQTWEDPTLAEWPESEYMPIFYIPFVPAIAIHAHCFRKDGFFLSFLLWQDFVLACL